MARIPLVTLTNSEQGRSPVVHRDRERAKLIIKSISEGQTTKMAAQSGSIARRTLYEWLYKAQEIRLARESDPDAEVTPYDEDYLWFLYEFELAEHSRKQTLMRRIDEAGEDPKRWQANAWLLERLHPDEFSLRQNVQITDRSEKEVFTLNIGGRPKQLEATMEDESGSTPVDFEIVQD